MSTKNLKEKFECDLCVEPFNQYDKKPYSIVPCGHTMCLVCLTKLEHNKLPCPFCRELTESKIPNWEIIKRLPKPTIPLIYNQIKTKLSDLTPRIQSNYFIICNEILTTTDLISKLIQKYVKLKFNLYVIVGLSFLRRFRFHYLPFQ